MKRKNDWFVVLTSPVTGKKFSVKKAGGKKYTTKKQAMSVFELTDKVFPKTVYKTQVRRQNWVEKVFKV